MAAKSVIQFVLGQFAKRSARKTGIPKILNANDSIVQSNALSIEKTLKNYGYDPSKMSSDDILKAMNYHKALMDQRMNFKFEAMGLSKGVDDLAKKPPFEGFKPKIVPKETEAQIKARMIKENRSNVQKSYLRQLDKKIMDEMDMTAKEMENMSSTALDDLRRNADPVGMKKQFDEITEGRGLGDFADDPDFFKDDYASGGLARVGMAGGGILKEFIERLFIKASNDIRQGKGLFKGLDQKQKMVQHDNLTKLVEQFQKTGKFDKKANEYFGIDAEKAFKDAEKQVLSKPTKTLEGIKKEGTIDISNPEVADEFSRFMKESDPEGFKNLEQQIQLDDFDVTGRKKNASGGIAGQLHLNEGGRARFQDGLSADYDIDSMRDPFASVPDYLQNLPTYDFGSDYYTSMNPDPYQMDVDKFKAAYAQSQGMGDKVSVNPDGQIVTDFGNYDPSNAYQQYVQNYNRIGDISNQRIGKFYDYERYGLTPDRIAEMKKQEAIMNAMYGAAGRGDPRDKPGYNEARMRGFKPEPVASTPVAEDKPSGLDTLKNVFKIATGSGAHEQATRDYLNPFHREKVYGTDELLKTNPDVVNYMAKLLKEEASSGKFNKENTMSILPMAHANIATAEGIAKAEQRSQDPAFQAANLFGQGTLRKTPTGYEYTGGKFDFNFGKTGSAIEKLLFAPSEYKLSFDSSFNPLTTKMQTAADKGMDARMGRTYAENKQIMADPRMLQAKGGLANILGV